MALQGYGALVKAQSSSIVFTDEATTTSDDKSYQITDAAKRILDYETDLVVKDDAIATTESYTVNKITGTVTFATSTPRTITLSGSYVVLATIAEASEFSFDGVLDTVDATVFQAGERIYLPTLVSATATVGKFYEVTGFFTNLLFDGSVKVVELYADDSGTPFRFYATVSANSISASVEDLTRETVTLQATDRMVVSA